MNISARQHIIAAFLVICYLLLPMSNFHHQAMAQQFESETRQTVCSAATDAAASSDCPCSNEHNQECCDSACCYCSCHIPLPVTPNFSYSPDTSIQRLAEPHRALPQVFLPIFVPPQNFA